MNCNFKRNINKNLIEKEWGTKKGPMAEFQAYWVNESKEAGKKFDIKINSKAEKGEELYTKKFANGNSLQTCFPDLTNAGTYPYYDKNKKS